MPKFKIGDRYIVNDPNQAKGTIIGVDVVNDTYTVRWDSSISTDTYADMAACEALWEHDTVTPYAVAHMMTIRKGMKAVLPDITLDKDLAAGTVDAIHNHKWEERQGFTHNFLACQCGASKDL